MNDNEVVTKQKLKIKGKVIALSPNGDLLLTFNQFEKQQYVSLWNVESGEKIAETEQFEFCLDSSQFAAGLEEGTVKIYQFKEYRYDGQKSDSLENHFQSIVMQSLLNTQQNKLNKQSKINSTKISIKDMFLLKRVIDQKI